MRRPNRATPDRPFLDPSRQISSTPHRPLRFMCCRLIQLFLQEVRSLMALLRLFWRLRMATKLAMKLMVLLTSIFACLAVPRRTFAYIILILLHPALTSTTTSSTGSQNDDLGARQDSRDPEDAEPTLRNCTNNLYTQATSQAAEPQDTSKEQSEF
jgi:hypothetical protein